MSGKLSFLTERVPQSSSLLSETQRATLGRSRDQLASVVSAIAEDRIAVLSVVIIAIFVVMAIFAPQLAPYDPEHSHVGDDGLPHNLEEPSLEHPFGTNHLGQDIFSQWIYGAQVSILVGFFSGLAVLLIGTTVGMVAGYYKGVTDQILMRVVDVLYGIPATPLILVIALFFGTTVWNIILAMVLVLWRSMARVIRSQALSVSEQPFIKAAKATGAGDLRIIYLHMAPNLLPLMLIQTTIVISAAITLEAGVSFLGVGAEDMISWGTMLQMTFATGAIREAWWWMIPPGISITMLVISFFYISRAIEKVTNPELKGMK